jgi:hypothetical protein
MKIHLVKILNSLLQSAVRTVYGRGKSYCITENGLNNRNTVDV